LNYATVSIPSSFPTENRPIHVHNVAHMSRKNKDTAYPAIATAVAKIITMHPEDRILVHTVSYDLNSFLASSLSSAPGASGRVCTYRSSSEKGNAIRDYLRSPNSVLLAPSLDRGIDLPGDDCRVIVVCKVPFPSLGDKQISAKLYSKGGQLWYSVNTVRSLVQMTGRGMRSEDDSCTSYILDSQFIEQIWRRNKHLLPVWWKDALNMKAPPL
jgi:Rad3-related DNA helicase